MSVNSHIRGPLILTALLCSAAPVVAADGGGAGTIDIRDPVLQRWFDATPHNPPEAPEPGVDYGMIGEGGAFVAPVATPLVEDAPGFPGQLDGWDQNAYARNVEVLAFYPTVTSPWHAWANVVDMDGKRYLYAHDRDYIRVLDVTDPANAVEVYSDGGVWGPDGSSEDFDSRNVTDYFGGMTIAWHEGLQKNVLVASYEVGRFGVMGRKTEDPEGVDLVRNYPSLKGFRVYTMDGPTPDDWTLIAERTTDRANPDAPIGQQQGSGSLDAPAWTGGRYMVLSAAPDDSFALTEYPDYLHSPGFQIWDMSDPADPQFVSQLAVPGQDIDDPEDVAAYLDNPRAGNRTSWMGSRNPLALPTPIEDGGRIGFGGMGGLGFWTFDVSDPADPAPLGNLQVEPSFAGTEFDNVDLSQFERTGHVFSNGYPMNSNCYEPYKDIYSIDVSDPANPVIAATFPRPTPPAEAGFTDYCQRRGSFGPKRAGRGDQPGYGRDGIVVYAFYNAGIQIFDVEDPANPKIAGYYVPRFPTPDEVPDWVNDNAVFAVFTEYDRNIIWAFAIDGVYALTSPLLGEPMTGLPRTPWPPRGE
ncbi:hypothetical protein OCGS_2792 [Oceaniovalibus guishaninsula JLT2003]|uniref:LVIVD repeat-containing protein n=1 Tax=Oceaniovalibus guishaninsula JLT2003 TaxID=1231392 RepID=K2GKE0_9RHOB|nr:hypothetical protein [Oceaniovalibus guishaninsula]EKE43201.1 hypothetical protein OCGS_2792 [Oceaniovalibus guishaninsula JLT2003]